MTTWSAYAIAAIATSIAVVAVVMTVRARPFGDRTFYAVAALEGVLLVQTIVALVALGRTTRDVDGVELVGYLLTALAVPPAAVFWGIADKTRWGTGVLAVGMVTVAVLAVRLLDIWTGRYA